VSTSDRPDTLSGEPVAALKAVPVRHPGRWVVGAFMLVLAAMAVNTLAFSRVRRGGVLQSRFQWNIIGHYFGSTEVLHGLLVTIELTAVAMTVGIALGIVAAVMRLSPNRLASSASWLYTWFFRGTPVLVQLFFWYDIAYIYPHLTIGVPFGPALFHIDANTTLTPFVVASVGLSLNEGAYMAEIVRAGIQSVDPGQVDAAYSVGMSHGRTLRFIVLPQAMRLIIPPTGNEVISMLKTSSLAALVTVPELLFAVQTIYSRTYETVPLLMVASLWYLAVTSVLSVGQYYVERRYARGSVRELPPTPFQRITRALNLRTRQLNTDTAAPRSPS
jgi:polar amino acid transport system permease protein